MDHKKLTTNRRINEMVDTDGVPYLCSSHKDIDDLFENIDRILEGKGLELLIGNAGDDNYWVQIVDRDRPAKGPGIYGVQEGVIHMTEFTDGDYEGFAGAGQRACIGEFTFTSEGNPMWQMFDGKWVIVADECGVGLYCTNDRGDDVCMTWLPPDENVTEALEFVASKMRELMNPAELLKLGFRTEYFNMGKELPE